MRADIKTFESINNFDTVFHATDTANKEYLGYLEGTEGIWYQLRNDELVPVKSAITEDLTLAARRKKDHHLLEQHAKWKEKQAQSAEVKGDGVQ